MRTQTATLKQLIIPHLIVGSSLGRRGGGRPWPRSGCKFSRNVAGRAPVGHDQQIASIDAWITMQAEEVTAAKPPAAW
jgi:hypothetical protein